VLRAKGQTTLAATIAAVQPNAVLLDLEREGDRAVLTHPELFLAAERVDVLDEVQFVPGLFTALRLEIDSQRRPGRFLLLRSASCDTCWTPNSARPRATSTAVAAWRFPLELSGAR
jgi:uncharacterized protein